MRNSDKTSRRRYHAPRRAAAAARTRERVVVSAKRAFEDRGWAGATIPLVAARAGVSHQTVEAIFGTKAALLKAVVDFSIRGDVGALPLRRREAFAAMEAAPDAASMLDVHASLVRGVSERSAWIAWVVEHAAASDRRVAQLWRTMTANRRSGVEWAAATVLGKPGAPAAPRPHVENVFWVALDWGTYRTLTRERDLDPAAFEAWLRSYYRGMLGA
jgi:AcrR family transcriptional regulator